MKKKLFVSLAFVLLTVAVVLSVAFIPTLADDDEDDADGVWCYTPNVTESQVIEFGEYAPPGKAFLAATYKSVWTGTFTGPSMDTGLVVTHIPEGMPWPGFPMLYVGTIWFDAVDVDGASGGLHMDVSADIIGDSPDAFSEWRGKWIITSGTGELEGLRGEGTWWGPGWQGDPEELV
jgi:hypothetical protein